MYTTVDEVAAMFPAFQRPASWTADTYYFAGSAVKDSNGNVQKATTPGSSGGFTPPWNVAIGGTTNDGSVVWTNQGGPSVAQKPSDAFILQLVSDVQGEVDAVLQRRFNEAIQAPPFDGSFSAFQAAFSSDALSALETITRYGAAAQLGEVLASFGIAGARDLSKMLAERYGQMRDDLDARDKGGRPLPSGLYDFLFDSLARVESPRPGLEAIAGADQPEGQTPADLGMSNFFGKFDPRGT